MTIPVSTGRIWRGYFLSAAVASACILALFLKTVLMQRSESKSLFPIFDTVRVVASDLFFFPVLWVMVVILSALPSFALLLVARRYSIRTIFFYIPAGVALGLINAVIVVRLAHGLTWYTDPPNLAPLRFWQEFKSLGRIVTGAGALAGLTFWANAGRYLSR